MGAPVLNNITHHLQQQQYRYLPVWDLLLVKMLVCVTEPVWEQVLWYRLGVIFATATGVLEKPSINFGYSANYPRPRSRGK